MAWRLANVLILRDYLAVGEGRSLIGRGAFCGARLPGFRRSYSGRDARGGRTLQNVLRACWAFCAWRWVPGLACEPCGHERGGLACQPGRASIPVGLRCYVITSCLHFLGLGLANLGGARAALPGRIAGGWLIGADELPRFMADAADGLPDAHGCLLPVASRVWLVAGPLVCLPVVNERIKPTMGARHVML